MRIRACLGYLAGSWWMRHVSIGRHREGRHANVKRKPRVADQMVRVQGSHREAVLLASIARQRQSGHQLFSDKARPAQRLQSKTSSLCFHSPNFPREDAYLLVGFRISLNNGSQCVSASVALASPGDFEECKLSGPGHKPTKSKTLGLGCSILF